jgi:hypothetical protein
MFLIFVGLRSKTCSQLTISPAVFLIFLSFLTKNQNLLLATTSFGANILICTSGGVLTFSVGRLRPTILNSFNWPSALISTWCYQRLRTQCFGFQTGVYVGVVTAKFKEADMQT